MLDGLKSGGESAGLSLINEIANGGKEAFPDPQTESNSPNDSNSEKIVKKEEVEKKEDGGSDTPFHKNPRFQEIVKKKNQYKEDFTKTNQENEQLKKDLAFLKKLAKDKGYDELTEKELKKMISEQADELYESRKKREREEKEEIDKFIDEKIQDFKDEGIEFDEKELLSIAEEYTDGDLDKAIKLYKKMGNPTKTKNKNKEDIPNNRKNNRSTPKTLYKPGMSSYQLSESILRKRF